MYLVGFCSSDSSSNCILECYCTCYTIASTVEIELMRLGGPQTKFNGLMLVSARAEATEIALAAPSERESLQGLLTCSSASPPLIIIHHHHQPPSPSPSKRLSSPIKLTRSETGPPLNALLDRRAFRTARPRPPCLSLWLPVSVTFHCITDFHSRKGDSDNSPPPAHKAHYLSGSLDYLSCACLLSFRFPTNHRIYTLHAYINLHSRTVSHRPKKRLRQDLRRPVPEDSE